ncbi:hypothetical protein KCU88_g6388, partial [Aureobasidium melanogenum]
MAAEVQGHTEAAFEPLRQLMQEQIASGEELGASLVIDIDGKTVVDIWGGWADEEHTQPWTRDTITNIWSSTKTVAALATLILADRGLLDVDAPVAKYWPEFGAEGKQDVLVRHLLSHTSGVSGWEKPNMTVEEVEDLSVSVPLLAGQKPWWSPPGSVSGYHSLTYGHLLGELVRRVTPDNKPMKQFVRDEIAGPLGADLQIGAEEKDWSRIAPVVPPPPAPFDITKMDPNSVLVKTFANPVLDARIVVTPGWRRADISAANGHSNARGLARVLSTVTRGGSVDGVKLLSQRTIDRIFDVQSDGPDLVVGVPVTFGIGYGLAGPGTAQSVPWLPKSGRVCFWGGWGGSFILMDLDRKVTFSYVMNKMGAGILGSTRSEAYFRAAYKALGVEGY